MTVEAKYLARREAEDAKRKYIIVDLEELEPLEAPRIDWEGGVKRAALWELRLTDIDLARYLTLVTPGGHLYEWAVVRDDLLYLVTSPRRKLFYEEAQPFEKLVIYLV